MDRDKTRPEKNPETRRENASKVEPGKNPELGVGIDDRRLLRLLHGELPPEEAAELRRRLGADPVAAARLQELERLWDGLELPPPDAAPPGFAARVAARAAENEGRTWIGAGAPFGPAWARAAAAVALAAGLALGAGVGWLVGERAPAVEASAGTDAAAIGEDPESADEWAYLEEELPTLAESYWDAFYEDGEEEL